MKRKNNPEFAPQEMEYLYDIPMCAVWFQVSEQTVRSWMTSKKLKSYRCPPADGNLEDPPITQRKSTLYTTRAAMADWAEKYYDL